MSMRWKQVQRIESLRLPWGPRGRHLVLPRLDLELGLLNEVVGVHGLHEAGVPRVQLVPQDGVHGGAWDSSPATTSLPPQSLDSQLSPSTAFGHAEEPSHAH